jgi:hypothetical protein
MHTSYLFAMLYLSTIQEFPLTPRLSLHDAAQSAYYLLALGTLIQRDKVKFTTGLTKVVSRSSMYVLKAK